MSNQNLANAEEAKGATETSVPWAKYYPYIPERREYQIEIGGMWEKNNLYWMGMTAGQHLGRCMFSESQKCQQYIDLTGGAGSRESLTVGIFMASLRWQYVSFPEAFSPSFRVLGGVANIRDNERDKTVGSYGLGVGFTSALHERLEFKWETRVGHADGTWYQTMFAISLKIDKWVDHFEKQVRNIGSKTTDTVMKGPKTFMEWFNSTPNEAESK